MYERGERALLPSRKTVKNFILNNKNNTRNKCTLIIFFFVFYGTRNIQYMNTYFCLKLIRLIGVFGMEFSSLQQVSFGASHFPSLAPQ